MTKEADKNLGSDRPVQTVRITPRPQPLPQVPKDSSKTPKK